MDGVEKLFAGAGSAKAFAGAYLEHTARLLAELRTDDIDAFASRLLETRNAGGTIWIFGNGGSAATALHFANDLAVGTRAQPPFRATCLSANAAILTAIGNDRGYEQVFSAQLEGRVEARDCAVAISASGRSPNVLAGVESCRVVGATTVALTGFGGGPLREAVDVAVHVPSGDGEYGPVEAIHTMVLHVVSNYLMLRCR